jgi:hypothetical protein
MRVLAVALLGLLTGESSLAAEAVGGRLRLTLPGEEWQSRSNVEYSIPKPDGGAMAGGGALLFLPRGDGASQATIFIGSTWNTGGGSPEGTCSSGARTYARRAVPDGFLTFGCALIGGPFAAARVLPDSAKRLAAALGRHPVPVPERAMLLQVVLTTENGGAILIEGLISMDLVLHPPLAPVAPVPAAVPAGAAAIADAYIAAAESAARSFAGRFIVPGLHQRSDGTATERK